MRVEEFRSLGGVHADSTALANLLAHHRVTHPRTGEPFSEAMLFGIAGGISAGYSFCPSIPREGNGAGVSIVGRNLHYAFDGTFHLNALRRLGLSFEITEASTPNAAHKKLVAVLESGRPALVWCGRAFDWNTGEGGMSCLIDSAWSALVVGLEEDRADVVELAPHVMPTTLESLWTARGMTCTHKNRRSR